MCGMVFGSGVCFVKISLLDMCMVFGFEVCFLGEEMRRVFPSVTVTFISTTEPRTFFRISW